MSNARAAASDEIVPFKLADIGEGITGRFASEIGAPLPSASFSQKAHRPACCVHSLK